jgi:D-glycero-D-manno-heptose 1,7-bisphosphate phosphatase
MNNIKAHVAAMPRGKAIEYLESQLEVHGMTKLIIFDKDGTLIEPISGGTFVQHPADQQLRPGVARKLEQLRADGVSLAIASNQGGCAVFEVLAEDIKAGMSIDFDGEWAKAQEIESTSRNTHVLTDIGRHTISGLFDARYKSINDAVAEMKFAMGLTGINTAFFCPDMAGQQCLWLDREKSDDPIKYRDLGDSNAIDGLNCRKPEPGMLIVARSFKMWREEDLIEIDGVQTWKPGLCLMVGDRPEDQAAAEAAGFDFCWADDFFGGGHE